MSIPARIREPTSACRQALVGIMVWMPLLAPSVGRSAEHARIECAAPPHGAIVLFDSRGTSQFVSSSGEAIDWPARGELVSTPNGRRSNNLVSRVHFRDARVHVEFKLPAQGDGNSGIFFQGQYELQILNSGNSVKLGLGDVGAIYGLHSPRVNAAHRPDEWQAFDVCFQATRRDAAGRLLQDGSITAWLNGRLIHDHAPVGERTSAYNPYLYDTTEYLAAIARRQQRSTAGPLILQDHDCPVRFRNIWILPLDNKAGYYDPDSPNLTPAQSGAGHAARPSCGGRR